MRTTESIQAVTLRPREGEVGSARVCDMLVSWGRVGAGAPNRSCARPGRAVSSEVTETLNRVGFQSVPRFRLVTGL